MQSHRENQVGSVNLCSRIDQNGALLQLASLKKQALHVVIATSLAGVLDHGEIIFTLSLLAEMRLHRWEASN
jgi:hypothetical protein